MSALRSLQLRRRRSRLRSLVSVVVAAALAGCATAPPAPTVAIPATGDLAAVWSSDGSTVGGLGAQRIVHAYDGATGSELWSFPADRSRLPGLRREATVERLRLLPAGAGALVVAQGELYLWRVGDRQARRLTSTPAPELDVDLAPNGRSAAFVRDGDLWAIDLLDGSETRLTTGHELAAGERGNPGLPPFAWAAESRTLAFAVTGPEAGVRVVDLPTQTLRAMETGGPAAGRILSYSWRPDARGLGIERLSPDSARIDLLLCHPEKLYCRELASRPAGVEPTRHTTFRFLRDGFLWPGSGAAANGLGRYDIVARQTGSLLPAAWRLRDLIAVDAEESWAIVTVTSTEGPTRSATAAIHFAGAQTLRLLAADRALARELFSPTRTLFVRFDDAGHATLSSLDGGRVAELPGLAPPAGAR